MHKGLISEESSFLIKEYGTGWLLLSLRLVWTRRNLYHLAGTRD